MLSFFYVNIQTGLVKPGGCFVAVGSVVNAIAILRHLASSAPQGVNAIARAVNLNPSSCFNLLKTLANEAFLEFDPSTKTYRATPPAWLVRPGADIATWTSWVRVALEAQTAESSVTCGLWQVVGERVVLLQIAESPLDTRIHLSPGQRLPAHIGAMGRCIAAHEGLSAADIARFIRELRWQDPPSAQAYLKDLKQVLKRGWSVDAGNYLRGVTTVASPILNTEDRVAYCITSTLFAGQMDSRDLERLGGRMAALAREASLRLRACTR